MKYIQYFDTDFPVKREAILYANQDVLLYEDFIKSQGQNIDLKSLESVSSGNVTFNLEAKIDFNDFIKVDKKSNQVFFFEELQLDDYYLITDKEVFFDWKIMEENKLISGYKTYKAETFFRGRKWIAWFTPELNFSFDHGNSTDYQG